MIKKAKARKAKAKAPKETVKPVEQAPRIPTMLPQIQRLASLGTDYGSVYNQNTLKGLYALYTSLSVEELAAQLRSPTLTALERSVIVHISKIGSSQKDSMEAIKYLHERTCGKVESKMELTGQNGGPVKIETDHKGKLERSVANMTDEELKIFEESMIRLQGIGVTDGTEAD